ncbi:MAG TPA: hypothetical protein PK867_30135 [Pirellulales bacterium]|nr:hypothetical protein [Pirellulales bacterium]
MPTGKCGKAARVWQKRFLPDDPARKVPIIACRRKNARRLEDFEVVAVPSLALCTEKFLHFIVAYPGSLGKLGLSNQGLI